MIKSILLVLSIAYIWISFRELFADLVEVYRAGKDKTLPLRLLSVGKALVQGALACGRCFAFWAAITVTRDPVIAAAASAAMDLYERIKAKYLS